MKIQLAKHEEMLFALLRAALKQEKADETFFIACTPEEWNACYGLAVKQGVMALAWDGIMTLPVEKLPPRGLKLKWAVAVDDYEKRYKHYCKTIQELSNFYASHGIVTVQMKGVGFSSFYPKPSHREGGDIDIYTYSADHSVMSDKEANDLADKLMVEQGIEVDFGSEKHSMFIYHGVPIENHKTFLSVEALRLAIPVEKALHKLVNPSHTTLIDGACNILTPSMEFNTVFLSFHALQHYGVGLSLHHLCDWACLLNHVGLHMPENITDKHYLQVVDTFTEFANRFLGTDVPVTCSEDRIERMLYEIFHSPFLQGKPRKNLFKILVYKVRHFIYFYRIWKELTGEPIYKAVFNSIIRHIRKPETILHV